MKIFNLKFLIQFFFFISIFNIVYAKNLDKYYDEDRFSNYFSGLISLNSNDFENSYKYLKQVQGLQKDHSIYSNLYLFTLVNLGRINEAQNFSRKLTKMGISNYESNLVAGIYFLKKKKYEKAKTYFDQLNSNNKIENLNDLIGHTMKIWVTTAFADRKESLRLINDIPKRFDEIKKIQKAFFKCLNKDTDTEENFRQLSEKKDTNTARYNFFYLNYLNNSGKQTESLNKVNNLVKSYPNNLLLNQLKIDLQNKKNEINYNNFNCNNLEDVVAEILYIISTSLSAQSVYTLSNFYLSLSKFLNPKFKSMDVLFANNLIMTDKKERAKIVYGKFNDKNSAYYWFSSKQIAYILSQQDKDSLQFITNRFNKVESPSIYQIFDYAEFLKNNEKFEKAILKYSDVINLIDKKHPLYPEATDGRGICYERNGKWEKAEKDFLNSLSVSPDQPYVINYLAYSWIEKGMNIEKSLRMLKKANKLKKNDGYIIDSLGWALFKLKKYEEAKFYLELAVRLMPSDPIVNDHYADSLWMNNFNIQARYFWQYVLKLEKVKKDLRENIQKKLIFGPKLKI